MASDLAVMKRIGINGEIMNMDDELQLYGAAKRLLGVVKESPLSKSIDG